MRKYTIDPSLLSEQIVARIRFKVALTSNEVGPTLLGPLGFADFAMNKDKSED